MRYIFKHFEENDIEKITKTFWGHPGYVSCTFCCVARNRNHLLSCTLVLDTRLFSVIFWSDMKNKNKVDMIVIQTIMTEIYYKAVVELGEIKCSS